MSVDDYLRLHPMMGYIKAVPELMDEESDPKEKFDSRSYQAASSLNHHSRRYDTNGNLKSDEYDLIGRLEINLQRFESEES